MGVAPSIPAIGVEKIEPQVKQALPEPMQQQLEFEWNASLICIRQNDADPKRTHLFQHDFFLSRVS